MAELPYLFGRRMPQTWGICLEISPQKEKTCSETRTTHFFLSRCVAGNRPDILHKSLCPSEQQCVIKISVNSYVRSLCCIWKTVDPYCYLPLTLTIFLPSPNTLGNRLDPPITLNCSIGVVFSLRSLLDILSSPWLAMALSGNWLDLCFMLLPSCPTIFLLTDCYQNLNFFWSKQALSAILFMWYLSPYCQRTDLNLELQAMGSIMKVKIPLYDKDVRWEIMASVLQDFPLWVWNLKLSAKNKIIQYHTSSSVMNSPVAQVSDAVIFLFFAF